MTKEHNLETDLKYVISHTRSLWKRISGKKIFLTGGTGFFGKWLLESFIRADSQFELNAKIHVLSRNPDAFRSFYPHLVDTPCVVLHNGDVRNFTFPDHNFDYIIHAATDSSAQANGNSPLLQIDTILDGTRRVLEFARVCGAKRLLYVSSGAVYGRQPVELAKVPETYPGAPNLSQPASAYGEAKRLAELLCSIYQRQYDLETVTARCFAFVGPYLPLDQHFAIGNFIKDALENRPIRVLGDGTTRRSYLYAADLAIWLWTILLLGKPGCAYNVGSDKEYSIFEIATKVSDAFGGEMEIVVSKEAVSGKLPDRYVPDISLAKGELGLDCCISLEDAIRRTVRFYQSSF